MKKKNLIDTWILMLFVFVMAIGCQTKKEASFPNILWITSEDNSPLLGCYGDAFATTPNLDKLASDGFLYTHAYANAPVCAPARNTIITGVYANAAGNHHMRSYNKKSEEIKFYPKYLQEAGYYCTNNAKTDYNIDKSQTANIWDETGKEAHYKKRKPGQPFFSIFNIGTSHEVSLHSTRPDSLLKHRPEETPIPPYHPATPEVRHDWAQYYDKIEEMDHQVGEILAELKASGEAENTIVFYYSDHGGVLGRSKRFVYETGTRVPFIVSIPERFKHLFPEEKKGSKIDRLISFVDLAPTLLSILNLSIPDFMQGSAFLGQQTTEEPEYAYMFSGRMDERYDMSRAVRDQKYRYIRNYMPYRPRGQHLNYLWKAPSVRSWEKAYKEGNCNEVQSAFWKRKPIEELYDTENDPWEINNLASNSQYRDVLLRMRRSNVDWVKSISDAGFIPEADLLSQLEGSTPYDYTRLNSEQISTIIEAAEMATSADGVSLEKCVSFLENEDSAIRYWGATGLLMLNEKAVAAEPVLKNALQDSSLSVVIVAAEALYNLGRKEIAMNALTEIIVNQNNAMIRCHALNAIDCLDERNGKLEQMMVALMADAGDKRADKRMAQWLLKKWNFE